MVGINSLPFVKFKSYPQPFAKESDVVFGIAFDFGVTKHPWASTVPNDKLAPTPQTFIQPRDKCF